MTKRGHPYRTAITVLLLAVGGAVGASAGNRSPETDLAAPGSPLYEYAVAESVRSLMSKEEQAELGVAGRPPSPGPDYYWCENCKAYHKRQNPASPGEPAVARAPGAAPAPVRQPVAGSVARPPSPGPDYYWCEQCKAYHQKQAVPNHSAPAVPGSSAAPVRRGSPPADVVAGSRPPSPGADYYWCEQCKTYHRRQAVPNHSAPAAPGSSAAPMRRGSPPAEVVAGSRPPSPGADYYWCEKCKTYHRRQSAVQHSPVDMNRIFGGGSNSLNWSPPTVPPPAEER